MTKNDAIDSTLTIKKIAMIVIYFVVVLTKKIAINSNSDVIMAMKKIARIVRGSIR